MAEIGAVLLAAGASQRFGVDNKLLADIGGKPLIRWVAEESVHSGAEVIVVTGCDHLLISRGSFHGGSGRSPIFVCPVSKVLNPIA